MKSKKKERKKACGPKWIVDGICQTKPSQANKVKRWHSVIQSFQCVCSSIRVNHQRKKNENIILNWLKSYFGCLFCSWNRATRSQTLIQWTTVCSAFSNGNSECFKLHARAPKLCSKILRWHIRLLHAILMMRWPIFCSPLSFDFIWWLTKTFFSLHLLNSNKQRKKDENRK